MRSSTSSIKALASRFASLPPLERIKLTKRLLDLGNVDQASTEVESPDNSSRPLKKNFLEQFWDEVEKAHGDHPHALNPFREERRASAREGKAVDESDKQGGSFPWRMRQSNLIVQF
jgi:hypothetical protein